MEVVEQSKAKKTGTFKVLIADDDPPTRILLRAALSQWGYEIIEAKDGEEAWNLLQQPNEPRLLIIDWLMPKMDGIALCEKIKEKTNYHPYIILLTQMTGSTNVVKGLEAGANEFLSKPFNMAELRSRLSVGARIIEFENLLQSKTDALRQNEELIKTMREHILKYSDEILTHLNTVSDDIQTERQSIASQKIQQIKKSIENIAQELKKLSPDQ